ECREAPGLDAGRIGLQGDLDVVGRLEQAARVRDQCRDGVRLHQARCTATKEDRAQPPSAKPGGLPCQLPLEGGAETGLRDALAHVRVEVAIRALGQAERPVDIEREWFHQREIWCCRTSEDRSSGYAQPWFRPAIRTP